MSVQIMLDLRPSTHLRKSLTMSLPNTENSLLDRQRVPPQKKSHWDAAKLLAQTLGATPTSLGNFDVAHEDRLRLIAHLGRKTLQEAPPATSKPPGARTKTAASSRSSIAFKSHPLDDASTSP